MNEPPLPPKVHTAVARLHASCELRDEREIEAFVSAVRELSSVRDKRLLGPMLLALRDQEASEVQYELIEACEAYPDPEYVPALAAALVDLRQAAPRWGGLLLHSTLNTPSALLELVRIAPQLSATERQTLVSWVREIAEVDPKHEASLARLVRLPE